MLIIIVVFQQDRDQFTFWPQFQLNEASFINGGFCSKWSPAHLNTTTVQIPGGEE